VGATVKTIAILFALSAVLAISPLDAQEARKVKPITTIEFPLTVATAAATCLPKATGTVTDHTTGQVDHTTGGVENLTVVVKGLPPNTDFDVFIIQVPKAPFGLAWYQGDISTDSRGTGTAQFVGRFNIETFIVSPAALPSPNTFPDPPAVLPQSTTGAVVNPVQLYHVGIWFNSASDALKAGCLGSTTPLNGQHNAGIQVLNTSTFPDNAGPLIGLQ
jgi:hypothetical protein